MIFYGVLWTLLHCMSLLLRPSKSSFPMGSARMLRTLWICYVERVLKGLGPPFHFWLVDLSGKVASQDRESRWKLPLQGPCLRFSDSSEDKRPKRPKRGRAACAVSPKSRDPAHFFHFLALKSWRDCKKKAVAVFAHVNVESAGNSRPHFDSYSAGSCMPQVSIQDMSHCKCG